MRPVLVVVALMTAALAASMSGTAPAAPTQSVTLSVARFYDGVTRTNTVRFSGAISSGQAGELVTVMQQVCGSSFPTSIAGAQTRSGGAWDAEPTSPHLVAQSADFHARWGNVRSATVAIRPEIPVYLWRVRKGRLRFSVSIGIVSQNMGGRLVVLERLRNGRWTVVRRQKLRTNPEAPPGSGSYVAAFVVPGRWTVRARIPAKSAAPCFKPNVTEKVRST